MAKDLVQIDRAALLDLIEGLNILTDLLMKNGSQVIPTDEENSKIAYVNKLVLTATESYTNNN